MGKRDRAIGESLGRRGLGPRRALLAFGLFGRGLGAGEFLQAGLLTRLTVLKTLRSFLIAQGGKIFGAGHQRETFMLGGMVSRSTISAKS